MYAKYAEIRDSKGLNDLKVARKTGVPQSTIYDWRQRSEKNPAAGISAAHLVRIAQALDVGVEDLV